VCVCVCVREREKTREREKESACVSVYTRVCIYVGLLDREGMKERERTQEGGEGAQINTHRYVNVWKSDRLNITNSYHFIKFHDTYFLHKNTRYLFLHKNILVRVCVCACVCVYSFSKER